MKEITRNSTNHASYIVGNRINRMNHEKFHKLQHLLIPWERTGIRNNSRKVIINRKNRNFVRHFWMWFTPRLWNRYRRNFTAWKSTKKGITKELLVSLVQCCHLIKTPITENVIPNSRLSRTHFDNEGRTYGYKITSIFHSVCQPHQCTSVYKEYQS